MARRARKTGTPITLLMTVTMESLPGGALATGAEAPAAAASGAPVRLWPDTAIGWSSGRVTSSSSSSQAEWWRSRGSLAMARPNTLSTARGSAGSRAWAERTGARSVSLKMSLVGPCSWSGVEVRISKISTAIA